MLSLPGQKKPNQPDFGHFLNPVINKSLGGSGVNEGKAAGGTFVKRGTVCVVGGGGVIGHSTHPKGGGLLLETSRKKY